MGGLSERMEALDIIAGPATAFGKSCVSVLKKCNAPSWKIIKKTAAVSGIGFALLGTVGFVFKLVSLPINNVIIGGMIKH